MNCKELDYRFEIDANIDWSPLVLWGEYLHTYGGLYKGAPGISTTN